MRGECPNNTLPGCNTAGYFYGGTPPKGSDENFNAQEDFAESVAAYVYPDDAQKYVAENFVNVNPNLIYPNYRLTSRWAYVDSLIR